MDDSNSTDSKKEAPITLRSFAARRFAALIVILAVLCLCVAVAAQPKSDAKTLLQRASEPGSAAPSTDGTPATLPYISGENSSGSAAGNSSSGTSSGQANGSNLANPVPGTGSNTNSGSCAPCGRYIGTQPQAIMCPMYCVAPGPVSPVGTSPTQPPTTTEPSPAPTPTPTPGEPTCGCGNITYQPGHVCPMFCMMPAN